MNHGRLMFALAFASHAHHGQLRKCGMGGIPPFGYFAHPVAVAMTLLRHGFEEDVVIAGVLHDVVEDTSYTITDIEARFGANVASLVDACTEQDKSLPWEKRKLDYLVHLMETTDDARAIALADKFCNLSDLLHSMQESLKDSGKIDNAFRGMSRGAEQTLKFYEDFGEVVMDSTDADTESEGMCDLFLEYRDLLNTTLHLVKKHRC